MSMDASILLFEARSTSSSRNSSLLFRGGLVTRILLCPPLSWE
ncbi:MAG: hypothetical protein QW039_04855 [Fervidicoccaceae archaeon]